MSCSRSPTLKQLISFGDFLKMKFWHSATYEGNPPCFAIQESPVWTEDGIEIF